MAYQNFYYNKYENICHLWDDVNGHQTFDYQPYAFQVDPKGEYRTLTDLKVKKVKKWSEEAVKHGLVYEHDVPVATRVLIDNYFESDEPSKNHRILIFDIEVEKGLKYSTVKEADNRITSIAYHYNGRYVCLLLDEQDRIVGGIRKVKITNTDNTIDVILKRYDTERELLSAFLSQWNIIKPTICSGWHSTGFDIPYLYNRLCKILNKTQAKRLSPIEIIEVKDWNRDYSIVIAGVAQMDYLQLYKKFTYNEEASYKLEAISQKQLGRGKFKYEGTLDDLYESDIDGFIEYNVNDVELIIAMDKKMDLIEIARGICHKGHVPYDDFEHSSVYLNGAIQTRCKRKGIVSVGTISKNAGKAAGAFVKAPNVGKHSWVYSIDLQSLYPNLIITQNNSLETQIGLIEEWGKYHLPSKFVDKIEFSKLSNFGYLDDDVKLVVTPIIHELFSERSSTPMVFSKPEFIDYLNEHEATVSSAGVIFTNKKKGIIPEILEEWFNERLMFRTQMKEFSEGSSEYSYLDRKQLITKILLNSLYGVLLLPSFRYYSKLSGESVTLSGQTVILFTDILVNMYYKNKLGESYDKNCVIYQDTDSVAGNSMICLETGEFKSIAQLFEEYSKHSHIRDPLGKEFTFPNDCKFPYYDEAVKNIKFGDVQYIEKHYVKKKRYKIRTKSGKELIVTSDHSIMISDENYNVSKVLTADIKIGDKVVVF